MLRVLLGALAVDFGHGFAPPRLMHARLGDMFTVRPFNYFGMRNALDSAWAVVFYMCSVASLDASGGGDEGDSAGRVSSSSTEDD